MSKMTKKGKFIKSLTVGLVLVVHSPTYGQSTSSSSSTTIPSATTSVKPGDWINWQAKRNILTEVSSTPSQAGAAPESQPTVCAPPRSRFLVTNVIAGSTSANTASASTSSNAPTVQGYYPSQFLFFHFQAIKEVSPPRLWKSKPGALEPPANLPCGTGTTLPSYDTLYQFQATDANTGAYYREGFTWGGMLIPYKFYVKDRTFKGNPSTVAFVGYEGWFSGMSLAGVLALGPGIAQSASTTSATPSTKSTSTSTAVTYTAATGFVATFGGSIKAGLLVGWDWQGSGNNFQYEGKTWVALSIGAGF